MRPVRVVSCVLSSVLLAGVVTISQPVTAAADTPAAQPATTAPVAPPPPTRDVQAARSEARASGQQVEVTADTTETLRRWSNPDGTLTDELSAGPVRTKLDGAWVAIDPTLRPRDGALRPVAAAANVRFSAGGDTTLASVSKDGVEVALTWPKPLPVPTVKENAATYADVLPGVDVEMKAGAAGYEQSFILKSRAAASTAQLRVPLSTRGVTPTTADGQITFRDAGGTDRAWVGAAHMWDAAGREAPVTVSLVRHGNGRALHMTPDAKFLADPATTFPVTVDPPVTVYRFRDAYINQAAPTTTYGTNAYLKIGIRSANYYVSYIEFPLSAYAGKKILDVEQSMGLTDSVTCDAKPTTVYKVTSSWTSTVTWNTHPTTDLSSGGVLAASSTQGGGPAGSSCAPNAWMKFRDARLTAQYQAWANSDSTNHGMSVRASSTDSQGAKDFASGENTSWMPRAVVTYNDLPTIGEWDVTASPARIWSCCGFGAPGFPDAYTQSWWTNTLTPTVTSKPCDTDGDATRVDYEVWDLDKAVKVLSSPLTRARTVETCGTDVDTWNPVFTLNTFRDGVRYNLRYRAFDGHEYSGWSMWREWVIDTTAPVAPIVTSTEYPENTWAGGPDQPGTFRFTSEPKAQYEVRLDDDPTVRWVFASTSSITLTVPAGSHTLKVKSVDMADNRSVLETQYRFKVAKLPPVPTGVTATTTGQDSAKVEWTMPADPDNAPIDRYDVSVFDAATNALVETVTSTSTPANVTRLNGSYYFTVSAHNVAGSTAQSARSNTIVVPAKAPAPPTNVTAVALDSAANVSWTAGAHYGSPITAYTVRAYLAATNQAVVTTQTGATTSTRVNGLVNGLDYYFTVTATNAGGVSAESQQSATVRPSGPLLSPSNVSATRGDSEATVSWDQPVVHAGVTTYAIRTYRASNDELLKTTQVPASGETGRMTRVVDGLVNGRRVYFTVTATTLVATTPESQRSNEVTPAGPPFEPRNVAATAGDTDALVSWAEPAARGEVPGDNGDPITSYTVTASPGGATATVGGAARSATVPGLRNGTSYTFTVFATNGVGSGTSSGPSNAVVPAGRPFPPGTPTVSDGGAGAVQVAWQPPAARADGTPGDNGSPITTYTVTASPAAPGGPVTVSGTSATVSGLAGGTSYRFTVVATNARGTSDPSPQSAAITVRNHPGAPTNVQVTVEGGVPTISWDPAADQGSQVSRYVVTASNGTQQATDNGYTYSLDFLGLPEGESFTFTVRAENPYGAGPASSSTGSVTNSRVPDPPTNVVVERHDGNLVDVHWDASVTHGTPVTSYLVSAYPAGGGSENVRAPQTVEINTLGFEDWLLDSHEFYAFSVYAKSAAGNSAPAKFDDDVLPPLNYVALGESYAAGESVVPFEPASAENGCDRSQHASYSKLLGSVFPPLEVRTVACSSGTIPDLYEPQHENDTAGGQLAALNERTNMVTLQIGGNDAGFGPVVTTCIADVYRGQSLSGTSETDSTCGSPEVSDTIRGLEDDLHQAYLAVQEAAPNAKFYVVNYPQFLRGDNQSCVAAGMMYPYQIEWINARVVEMNQTIQRAIGGTNAEIIDVEDAFDGHEVCTGSGGYVRGVSQPVVFSFHPTKAGQEAMATLLWQSFKNDLVYPEITSVEPTRGPDSNSSCLTSITIRGSFFSEKSTVYVGGQFSSQVEVVNDTTIVAQVPPAPAGPASVAVTTGLGLNWGGTDPTLFTFDYEPDTSGPTASSSVLPAPNAAGWNRTTPTVNLSASDTTCSGDVESITYTAEPTGNNGGQSIPTTTVPADRASFDVTEQGETTVSYSTRDSSGNVSETRQVVVRVDTVAPTASAAPARAPDRGGYYNAPVRFTWSGTDGTSGIASCSSLTYSGPDDATASVSGSCTDVAGNSTGASYGFRYDATAPAGVRGVASRAPDSNGWYNHAFDVAFTGSDAVSGIDSCTESTYSGPDDATVTLNGSCTDVAGNTANASFGPVKYDGTGAEATIDGSTAQIVTAGDSLTGDGTDNLSGVARVVVTFQPALGGEPIRRTADCVSGCGTTAARWTVSTDGLFGGYDVTAVATDVAGNAGPASATVALTVLGP